MKTLFVVVFAGLFIGVAGCETAPDQQDEQSDETAEAVEPDQSDEAGDEPQQDDSELQADEDAEVVDEPTEEAVDQPDDSRQDRPGATGDKSDDFERQPRMEQLRQRTDMDAGTTDWQPSERQIPEQLVAPDGEGARSAGQAMATVAEEFRLYDALSIDVDEVTVRVKSTGQDSATGIILQWGLKDDAVAGNDLRVELEVSDGAWYVEQIEQRHHCRRGVTDDGLCL